MYPNDQDVTDPSLAPNQERELMLYRLRCVTHVKILNYQQANRRPTKRPNRGSTIVSRGRLIVKLSRVTVK